MRSGAPPGGERHWQEPFARRLVADGCEELGCYGAAALVERHADELRAFEHVGLAYTDTAVVLKRGFRGLTIDALRREGAGGAYWHQMADTVDKIEPDCLRRVHEFAWEMLRRLDLEGTQQVALLRSEPGFTFPEAPE